MCAYECVCARTCAHVRARAHLAIAFLLQPRPEFGNIGSQHLLDPFHKLSFHTLLPSPFRRPCRPRLYSPTIAVTSATTGIFRAHARLCGRWALIATGFVGVFCQV